MPSACSPRFSLDDLFPVIGMSPALGRGFTREEIAPNAPPVAIISHRLWQTRFGSDPAIVNRPIRIGGVTATVVGVMPPGLVLIGTDLWIPWGGDPSRLPRNRRQFSVLARLAPAPRSTQANAELATIAGQVEQTREGRIQGVRRLAAGGDAVGGGAAARMFGRRRSCCSARSASCC